MSKPTKDSGIEWIGLIPETWTLIRGKYLFAERNERGNKYDLQLLSPTQRYGVVPQELYEELSGMKAVKLEDSIDLTTLKSIYVGDYCISLRSFQGGFEYSNYNGVVSPAYHVFRKITDLCDGYYRYLFKERCFIEKMASLTKTFRDGKSIGFDEFSNSFLPVPPIDEQQRIAGFLDSWCAKIDGIIENTKRTLEEYKALKQSIITRAVTKGIQGDVELHDSGVSWIGSIPKHWSLCKIGSQYYERRTKVSDRDYPPLSVTKKGIVPQLDTAAKTDAHDDRKLVLIGDFAINSRSDRRGSCGISRYDGSVSLINTILVPRDEMNPQYYEWLFHSVDFADEFYKWGHGIVDDLWTTGWQDMKKIVIPCPPLEEQQEIADYLATKCAAIDLLIEQKTQLLGTLETYRGSVIYEYVTGKKEVPVCQ